MGWQAVNDRIQIMGVINITPDSFSDGGQFNEFDKALAHARRLIEEGVDILDVGGESTRPGSQAVVADEEIRRTVPLIAAIREFNPDIPISIDTNKSEVMREAVAAGATLINSVWALRLEDSLEVAASLGSPVCLMHMQGEPGTMQKEPYYDDVVAEVCEFLEQRADAARQVGIAREKIILDPGFGFGKTLEHNLQLLKHLPEIKKLGYPVLVGLSRKRMIGTITGKPVDQRVYGSVAVAVISAMLGADIVRVHDVDATRDALSMVTALEGVE